MSVSDLLRTISPEQIAAMRDWLTDCVWGDMDSDDFDSMPDYAVIHGVSVHYHGGIKAFLQS